MQTVRTVVKLEDANPGHEKQWAVISVWVSARVLGTIYQSASALRFWTKAEAQAFVREAKERDERGVLSS